MAFPNLTIWSGYAAISPTQQARFVRDKDEKMTTRLDRRREALNQKLRTRLGWTAVFLFGTPVALWALSVVWKLAVAGLLS